MASGLCLSQAKPPDTQWSNVKEMSRKTTFIFVLRDRHCAWSRIKRADDSTVTIGETQEVVLQRADLLRVTSAAWAPSVIFSGRSSWFDVEALIGSKFHPPISIITKSGQQRSGKLVDCSDDHLAIESGGRETRIGKEDISTVSYVRPKPLSDGAAYANSELAWGKIFDPQLWPIMLHLQPSVSVRLYDASVPEDNSRILCEGPAPRAGLDVTQTAYRQKSF